MAKEIERKFLVATDGWRQHADKGIRLRQAYVVTMEDRSVRVRIHGNKRARLTIKIGKSALVRNEYEYDLPMNDARELLTQAIGIVIEKRRFRIPHKGFTWEVDVYEGALEGLTVAEVEMKRETDLPNLPAWLGREITGDRRYSNQALATEGLLEAQT
ncbi:CYTH domain-containing protein [Sinorhizobium meliloti WSM1022]|jgi:adenylate cyclase|uniref:CYTH domain-containing protein n=3 Tax=Rhizobium meliloti TaxID=382 RepID=Q92LX7_RHIME|nr:CYTH domain-containing protein [Sinorhizobium meliloti]PST22872.1 CYTH domain-containing protein [Mesorhizobium loti]TWA96459.1 CYTH domain-containing protein [Ensifer sp. SEMIA 134]TWB31593.1 CYTH domain-containing protein [Ensifer sp. SEMIA 135]AEG05611.1 adenylate cyclase [Sinorhizobium meliloti BL225C]AEG54646.1 adenylate cyclase [Sinorhizobium meliloti AK83]